MRDIRNATLDEDFDMIASFVMGGSLLISFFLIFMTVGRNESLIAFISIIFVMLGFFVPFAIMGHKRIALSFAAGYILMIGILPKVVPYTEFSNNFLVALFYVMDSAFLSIFVVLIAASVLVVLPIKYVIYLVNEDVDIF